MILANVTMQKNPIDDERDHIRINMSFYAKVNSVKDFFDESNSPRRDGFHLNYYDEQGRQLNIRQAVETLGDQQSRLVVERLSSTTKKER